MKRFFNTAGPCKADIHYLLSPVDRLPKVLDLIEQQGYFVIHAPRQTGKTTVMMALAQQLTESGHYTAIVLSVETGAAFNHDPIGAQRHIVQDWWVMLQSMLPSELQPPSLTLLRETLGQDIHIGNFLALWARKSPRPLVVFIDEIDALTDEALITVLRQLRAGFPQRPQGFPHSLALIGVRDVRDYKVKSGGSDRLGTASPFNIKVESFTLGNFSLEEIKSLYQQHTEATGQIFLPDAIDRVFDLTQGQPWLVNAIARQLVQIIVPNPAEPITIAAVNQAKELIIQRQETHLDSLVSILREPRVRAVFEPMLAGDGFDTIPEDDRQFLVDLGLVRRDGSGGLIIANRIYQEIIPRVLA
ncbi:MAG: AAA-like domain-containing protein, partial [Prochlorotrichaceae cyanobacterium]